MAIDKSLRQHYAFGGTGGSTGHGGHNGGGGGRPTMADIAGPTTADIAGPTPSGISPQQSIAMTGNTSLAGNTPEQAQASVDRDNASKDRGTSLHGGETVEEAIRKADIKNMIKSQQEEKFGVTADPTKFGETVEGPDLRTQKEKDEDIERATDWDKVKKLSKKGYNFTEIQNAMEKGLLTKADPQSMKTNLFSRGINSLRNLIPETRLEKNLLGDLKKSFAPTEKSGFWSGIGKLLSWVAPMLIPALLPAKLVPVYKTANTLNTLRKFANKVTDKDIMASLTTKFSTTKNKTKTKKSTTSSTISEDPFGNGKGNGHAKEKPPIKNVVQESVQEFLPQQTDMMKKHSQLQGVIESGSYQGKQLTAEQLQMLQQKSLSIQKLIEQYLVPVAHGGLIDSPLMGRSRDI